jgi:gamma-glutamylcysteine synthetase
MIRCANFSRSNGHFIILQDFLAGRLPCIPGELPTLNDWENHLTTIFPEVKLFSFWFFC